MFTLAKMAYYACTKDERLMYDGLNATDVDLKPCCTILLKGLSSCCRWLSWGTAMLVSLLAAKYGHDQCLWHARKNGCVWNAFTARVAARYGRIECLRLAREDGCPWNKATCYQAARYGHLDCLRYAHENGCPWEGGLDESLAADGDASWYWSAVKIEAVQAYLNECRRHVYATTAAATGGHLECLRYAHEHGCPWNEQTTSAAAGHGHLECLRYARENGCPWNKQTTSAAAGHGHLECLRYARENGCPWNERTAEVAARHGHWQCLEYALTNGSAELPQPMSNETKSSITS